MFCEQCGNPLVDKARFCMQCGARQTVLPAEEVELPQPPVQPAPAPVRPAPAPAEPPVRPAPRPASTAVKKEQSSGKKNNTAMVIVIVVLAVLLVAAVIVFAVSVLFDQFKLPGLDNLFSSSQSKDDDDDEDDDSRRDPEEDEDVPAETQAPVQEVTEDQGLNPSNPYYACFDASVPYLLPDSAVRYLAPGEVQSMTEEQLTVAYHEIDARHGATFSDPQLQVYFEAHSWYTPGTVTQKSEVELKNQEMIQANLDLLTGQLYRSDNPYVVYLAGSDTYMIGDSATRYLTAEDLETATDEQLMLIRNEIYARHGYIFKDQHLREFFYCKSWYVPTTASGDFSTEVFNDMESANVKLIQIYEKLLDGVTMSSSNPYAPYYNDYSEFIFASSSERALRDEDLYYLSLEELILARNEIYARNGYGFSDTHLFEYFAQCSWYRPSIAPGRKDEVPLTKLEKNNITLIQKYEEVQKSLPENYNALDGHYTHEVETKRFTVIAPEYWEDYCVVKKDSKNGTFYVRFYEKVSYNFNGTGHLFTVALIPVGGDFYDYPSYAYLGALTDFDGITYDVIVIYPTDVQPIYPAESLYSLMWVDVDDVLYSFTAAKGCTFYAY